jgi:hypothetical protein
MKKRLLALALVATFAGTACYGKFALTRKVYTWNGHVTENKFANSAIMWGLFIIPVYELSSVVDLFILNTIEVLSGSNPVGQNDVEFQKYGHTWRLHRTGALAFDVARDGQAFGHIVVEQGRLAFLDTGGRELGAAPHMY